MAQFKLFKMIIKTVLTLLFMMYFDGVTKGHVRSDVVSIGAVFDKTTDEIQEAFKLAVIQFSNANRTRWEFQLFVDVINTADAFKLSRLICNQFNRNVISMLGAVMADSFDTLHSYTNTFQLPFMTPWFPEKVIPPSSGLKDYAVSMRPDYHQAVIDTITYYGWKNVIFIYDSHDGLLRLQQLYQSLHPSNATFRITNVKRISNATDVIEFLGALEKLDRWTNKYVVLDSSTQIAKEALILHVRSVQLGRRNYHYFLSGLVMDDRWEKKITEFGAINITGFRIVDFTRRFVRNFSEMWKRETISAQAALMYDGVQVLIDAIFRLLRKKPDILRGLTRRSARSSSNKTLDCFPKIGTGTYEIGDKISRLIKKTDLEGLTGPLRFDEKGTRCNFSLQVVEMTVNRDLVKIGTWYDHKGLITRIKRPKYAVGKYNRNKTYIVSTIEEPPYVIRDQEPAVTYPFRGFCVDLAFLIFQKMEINYELRTVKDGKYGKENTRRAGGWDGMVGELIRKEADLAIAPLTVTPEREGVVDFSKPFLSFDAKPEKPDFENASTVFTFLHPLSKEIWLCILFSMFAVSIVLFFVSRFSPSEWRLVSVTESQSNEHNEVATTKTTVINEFSFWNSIWFSIGSFMQQGSDISPRSLSGRIVGAVWWFFTLVVICSYTANLASYLTLARISDPTQLYIKVTSCPEDLLYGQQQPELIEPPTTESSEVVDEHGWLFFLLDRSSLSWKKNTIERPCEMVVTTTKPGLIDFAVAFPKGSELRDGVNIVLQKLRKDGDLQILLRKWFIKTECEAHEQSFNGLELTLGQVAGLFYILMGGLLLALAVALFEFFQYGRVQAAKANIPLRAAFKAKSRLPNLPEIKTTQRPAPQREQERIDWNSGPYSGYYTPASHIAQEETALRASFAQV
ncbi:PREDICTED: glutamate receptor 1-like [Papilio polytes]|uniref:glutamate receptor 1-like n=1 Tax=Papilio polytes TaxID=76194 RepID=UPI000675CEC6|nr:PREDICTED: glutamate receptor 1-like [Papilio polytes]